MNFRCIFSALTVWVCAFAAYPSNSELKDVYDVDIVGAREFVQGVKKTNPSGSTALQRFSAQGFLLWDYLTGIDSNFTAHFTELGTFCVDHNITRVIVFIKDPSAFDFFDPTNPDADHFVGAIQALKNLPGIAPGFSVSVFFADNAFTYTATGGTAPTSNPLPSTATGGEYFEDILAMLNWSKEVIANTPLGLINEICFDPQAVKAINTSGKIANQYLYNYVDEYKYLNDLGPGQSRETKLGTTVGIGESKETFSNVFPFPVMTIYTSAITNFPTQSAITTWRGSSSLTDSIMQSVYIQCYQTSIPALFAVGSGNGGHNGHTAGKYMVQILRDQPYLNGVGKLLWTGKELTITGQGTRFTDYATTSSGPPFPVLQTPILYPLIDGAHVKLGEVSSIQSNTEVSTETNAKQTATPVPFKRTEIATAWDAPQFTYPSATPTSQPMTQEVLDKIYWMFSRNNTPSADRSNNFAFFGSWALSDFMDFTDAFISQSRSLPVFTTGGTTSPVLQISKNNLVLYQWQFVTATTGNFTDWNLQ